jgi:hypothetical protein
MQEVSVIACVFIFPLPLPAFIIDAGSVRHCLRVFYPFPNLPALYH